MIGYTENTAQNHRQVERLTPRQGWGKQAAPQIVLCLQHNEVDFNISGMSPEDLKGDFSFICALTSVQNSSEGELVGSETPLDHVLDQAYSLPELQQYPEQS